MSFSTKLTDLKNSIASLNNVIKIFNEDEYNIQRSGEDANNVFTITEYRNRSTNILVRRSVLSGGTSPEYIIRTLTLYNADGVTAKKTYTYSLSYTSGIVTNESLINVV